MLMAGSTITAPHDALVKVDDRYLYSRLVRPKPEVEAHIRQLRIIANIDPQMYAVQKKALPYIVCGIFSPPFRLKANFAYTDCFILDIDKLRAKGLDLQAVRKKVEQDERVVLSFVSPSGDGLKLLFNLSEPCHDPNLYSIFYKAFAHQFSSQYGLEQAIDSQTCDVSRACFVSVDPDAYYHAEALKVRLNDYIDTSNPLTFADQYHAVKKEAKARAYDAEASIPFEASVAKSEPSDEVMQRIKEQLKLLPEKRPPKEVYVPAVLEETVEELQVYLEQMGLRLTEVVNIQYGKKLKLQASHKLAEINLFYGKRGYSVVISPRTGTDDELNKMVATLIESFVYQY